LWNRFRAEQPPPRDPELGEYAGPVDGHRPISLGDALAFAMANESTRAVAEAAIAQARQATTAKVCVGVPFRLV
jgi:hypothetical protein